jgi:uncharacterized membrane protein YgaE (UPF0421/DUF939 family)
VTDPSEAEVAPARPVRRLVDRALGSDPGFNRLRSAAMSVITIGLILAAETVFVRISHGLQIVGVAGLPAGAAVRAAAVNHEHLVVMMLIGSIVGMTSSFGVNDPTAKGQLETMLLMPIPLVGTLALGLAVGGNRALSLVLIVVIATVGTYIRRFPPRGMVAGILLFFGFFFGFFLHAAVTVHDLGWLTAAIGVGLVVAIAVRFLLFFPNHKRALQRTQRSFVARAQRVAGLVLDLFDSPHPDPRTISRLQGHLLRLNEAALMIDAQLGDPTAVPDGSSRQQLHQRLFDFELALTNMARFAQTLARLELTEPRRSEVRLALLDVERRNPEGAKEHAERLGRLLDRHEGVGASTEARERDELLHRFASSIVALADASTAWLSAGATATGTGDFTPAVNLFAGWLPGSAGVSSVASIEPGDRPDERVPLKPWTRMAIQTGIAMALATAFGDMLDASRYYWAVIAVFVTFMGANNSGEQTRRALYRISGTVIGIVIGSLVVDAVGNHAHWTIAVVLVAFFLGMYLMRINYTFFVIAITIVISQLYQELHVFSNNLLLWRLAETALGAVITILVVTFVLPLRSGRVLRVAFRNHVRAIGTLVDHASGVLTSEGPPQDQGGLLDDARAVDASYQALVATAQPLNRGLFGGIDEEMGRAVRLAAASRNYSRDLVADLASTPPLDPALREGINQATATLHRSMDTVANAMTGTSDGVYVRSSSLYDLAERSIEDGTVGLDWGYPAIRDFQLIDGSMAGMAEFIRLKVADFDTSGAV